jgi:hypothetical protein
VGFLWTILGIAFMLALFWVGARLVMGGGRRVTAAARRPEPADQVPRRDLNANINPSQHGNEADKWPDRTGARTRAELGAVRAIDVSFVGDRAEGAAAPARITPEGAGAIPHDGGPVTPGVRNEVKPGPHEHGPGMHAAALPPEAEFGENRPANRTVAPDQPPTQWHPKDHGAPGDHTVDGHHRSATGPERHSSATDPMAHAPLPGPNHVPPEGGDELPRRTRP